MKKMEEDVLLLEDQNSKYLKVKGSRPHSYNETGKKREHFKFLFLND